MKLFASDIDIFITKKVQYHVSLIIFIVNAKHVNKNRL